MTQSIFNYVLAPWDRKRALWGGDWGTRTATRYCTNWKGYWAPQNMVNCVR